MPVISNHLRAENQRSMFFKPVDEENFYSTGMEMMLPEAGSGKV